ncbi:MAG: hypothetical protein NVSMB53_16970 [Gemmatimonadaceae bacterium]
MDVRVRTIPMADDQRLMVCEAESRDSAISHSLHGRAIDGVFRVKAKNEVVTRFLNPDAL